MEVVDMHYHGAPKSSWSDVRPERHRVWGRERRRDSNTPTLRFHRVDSGETLTEIAEKYYGDESFWVLLYGANEERLREERGVHPGQILYVPFL